MEKDHFLILAGEAREAHQLVRSIPTQRRGTEVLPPGPAPRPAVQTEPEDVHQPGVDQADDLGLNFRVEKVAVGAVVVS